jgi:hypothetical protein
MKGREAPTTLIAPTQPRIVGPAEQLANVYEPNFGLLASDTSWRTTWSAIVAGRFTQSHFSSLLFVEHSTAYGELYETDGHGRLVSGALRRFDPLGDRATWTHVVPGFFGPSGFTGLLLYDGGAGVARFYDSDGHGDFVLRSEYSGWRTTWSHIVSGRFAASSPYSGLFFYSASENYGEIWATDGKGLAGTAPRQTLENLWTSRFTHVLAGEFHWTPGYIDRVPTLSDVFLYDAVAGHGEMYRSNEPTGDDSALVLVPCAVSDALPRHVTSVVAGNFGGIGNQDLAFYEADSAAVSFYSFRDTGDTSAELELRETQRGLRRSPTGKIVAGNFWMANREDHWFDDGPPVSSTPPFDPDWRFNTGAFSDLLLYDRAAGRGDFFFHEPLPPPPEPLDGYITCRSSHGGEPPVATGSVVPGESIAFHVGSQQGPYSITIYRQGFFPDGTTEQMMAVVDGLPANSAPLPIAPNAYRDGARWPASASFVVPSWPTGLYLARVETTGPSRYSIDLPFVVRAAFGSPGRALLVMADTTYNAYNDWGGRNSYGHVSGDDFVGAFPSTSALRIPFGFRLAFDRPFHGGFGNAPQTWEIPFIQWLGRRDVPVDVCTSRDLHFEAPQVDDYRLLLFVGHHEYWTAEMRTHVEAFTRAGGNVAFFTGNTCWWQIRVTDDGSKLICYKVAGFDPVSTRADHVRTTVHWFDDLVKRPETTLTGVSWLGDGGLYYDQDHRFRVKRADHWIFAGTGLTNGATFGGYSTTPGGPEDRSVAGPESDRVQHGGPNGLTSPANFTLASIYEPSSDSLEVGTMGIFQPTSDSGLVFNAPTLNWALGLSRDPNTWNVVDQITLNVISKLGPPPPPRWTSVSEGITAPGAPVTAILAAPDEVALFLADPAGGVYAASGVGEQWSPWTTVSEGGTRPGAYIAAVVTGQHRLTLLLADPAGGVYTTSGNPEHGWRPWTSVSEGSTAPGAPIAAVAIGSNVITVFLADPAGGVYTTSGNAEDGWRPWSSVSEGRTTPGAPVSVVSTGSGGVALFLADAGGGVYTTSSTGSGGWRPWSSVSEGRSTPGATISAVAVDEHRIAVFLADPAGGVYTTSGNASDGWRPWRTVSDGRTVPGAPVTALITGPNRVTLFLADPAGGVYTTSGNDVSGWRPWTSVAEGMSTPGGRISAVLTAPNRVALFLADPAGGVYTTALQLS